ncbi:MAG: GtrA family protein [Acidobacteriaceae bacterium]
MSAFSHWWRFNLVGIMGMGVQLAALAVLSRWTGAHYLYATMAALEFTLLHNFVWHLHFTWADRCNGSELPNQFVRFHLSNGMVSLVGNLVLMRMLVGEAHLPLLIANGVAILCCSTVNFCVGNYWIFAEKIGESLP